ncbi:MAG: deoxyribose-phosphate aldolase [Anaerolineae bacterium]|nr:deoxyribose-phosphate aldolase [Anaerolineae bacterium]
MSDQTLQIPDAAQLARMIDHTLLKPEAVPEQFVTLCQEAKEYHFASVCVNPAHVAFCAEQLKGVDDVLVGCTVGFPLGANLPETKAFETEKAIADGAGEVDMVLNVGALKSGNLDLLRRDMAAVVDVAHRHGIICKVILETCLLTDEEKETACVIAKEVGADFVKTSTGFNSGGATVEDIALMRRVVGPEMGVKASGGVRTYTDALNMIAAGATRIGASAGVRIVQEAQGKASGVASDSTY